MARRILAREAPRRSLSRALTDFNLHIAVLIVAEWVARAGRAGH